MDPREERPASPSVFIVRIRRDGAGGRCGVVERVRTGAKAPFQDLATLGRVIADLLAGEEP